MKLKVITLALFLGALLFMRCTLSPLAGGSDNPDFRIVGVVVTGQGTLAEGAVVQLLPAGYDPLAGAPGSILTDTADAQGRYSFTVHSAGNFQVQAGKDDNTRLLITGLSVLGDYTYASMGVLNQPGAIKVMLPDSLNNANGYVYIPGTTIFAVLADRGGSLLIDSVPVGTIPSIVYKAQGSSAKKTLGTAVAVTQNSTTTIWPAWQHSKQLVLNTTPSCADVAGTLIDFPVLVRLSSANFTFAEARADGGDLRFTTSDGTPLHYEIERFDPVTELAEVWVKVDTVRGNNGMQFIIMNWGASTGSATVSQSNSMSVFDTTGGFQGVWHMNESAANPAVDATVNHYNGTGTNTTQVGGVVGSAQKFDGSTSIIRMIGTSNGKLNFPENGTYSVGAWVRLDTLDNRFYVIASKDLLQYTLQVRGSNWWEFHEFEGNRRFESTSAPASAGTWSYVVGVRSGSRQYLYVNGSLADSTIGITDTITVRVESNDLFIGRLPVFDGFGGTWRYFKGAIDEVRIASGLVSADWIRLCYANQKPDGDKLVEFK